MTKRKTASVPTTLVTSHAPLQPAGIFHNAITEADGVSVNVGYLSLFWVMIGVLGAIPLLILIAIAQLWLSDSHAVNVQELGVAIGAVCTGFGVALGALGLFLMGDRKPMPPATTVSMTQTTVP
jgi:hypothetical protein